jgi:AraC family transcriptional regulator, regulatory protein of adaptative response / DNA-3-methyladenine glycosylase II
MPDVMQASLRLRLAYRPPFAAEPLLRFLAARAIPGVEHVDLRCYRRSLRMDSGAPIIIGLAPDLVEPHLDMLVTGVGFRGPSVTRVVRAARRAFDLDADPRAIDETLAADVAIRRLVVASPGTRLPGAIDGFEMAVRAVVGQQVSVAGARTTLGHLVDRFGERLEAPVGPISHLFPTPDRIAGAGNGELGMPSTRAEALRSVARAVTAGEIDLSGGADLATTASALRSIKGIGEWTVAYVSMRALRDRDAFPERDLGVRRAFASLGLQSDTTSIRSHAERWRPWRAYAAMHLWNADS